MKFKKGGCWEFAEFEIVVNNEISSLSLGDIYNMENFKKACCKHAHSFKADLDDDDYVATIPFIVIAKNEAGHASTGVCAECIMEGLEKMKKQLKREKK